LNGYTFHITLFDLALLILGVTGLNFALLLAFTKRTNRSANRFLALALVVTVLQMISVDTPLPLQFGLALGPSIYFYVRKITRTEYKFRRKDLLHFSPLLVGYWLPAWLGLISVIIYLYPSHRLIQDFYRRLRPVLMDRPRFAFRGLDRALFLLGLVCVLTLFNAIFFFAFALVLTGMTAEAILKPDNDVRLVMPVTDRSDAKEKGRRLRETVAANRLYGDAELTLATLAVKLNIHPHDLSRIINVGLEKNFSDFINEFRVREISRKMRDPAYDRLTLLGIAYESGFNSKTTFNRVFKEMTGKTPAEYKHILEKEVPIDKLAPRSQMRPVILHPEGPSYRGPGTLKSNIMIKNYFKIAWRNLVKNKSQSFINITGLSVGMAVALLIGLWIYDELSFNKYHQHYDRIGQVMIDNGEGTYKALPIPLSQELRSSFGYDFKYVVLSTDEESHIIAAGDKRFMQPGRYMQPEAPEMLTLKMISGSRNGLENPNSILLKQSLAGTLFGNADPIGRVLKIDNMVNVTVTGVYEDLPNNSEFKDVAFIAPWDLYVASSPQYVRDALGDWQNSFVSIYVQLNPNEDFNNLSAKIKDLKLAHTDKQKADRYKPELFIHPMSKWHLFSKFENRVIVTSEELKFVWFYGIIGAFVLLLACINFMNLSTARSEKRAKEVGIRKTMGSARIQLITQFFSESVLIAAFAYLLSIGLIALALPWFNDVAGKTIRIPFENAWFWLTGAGFIIITGLLAGCYPALYLSSFNAVNALKGTFRAGRFAAALRKALVVIQFTASTILIIGTIVVYRQIQFAKNRPVGYSRDGLITVQMNTPDFQGKYDLIRNELKNTGVVSEVAGTGGSLTGLSSETGGIGWPGKHPNMESSFGTVPVTFEFGKTVGWQFTDGRDFSSAFPTDTSGVVINEAAVKYMALKNPVGKMITGAPNGGKAAPYKILGVIKDMVMSSPFEPAYPTVFYLNGGIGAMLIRISPDKNAGEALAKIQAVFKNLVPAAPFDYTFVNEEYGKKFAAEERIGKLAGAFASLAIMISCLGLFGLASFVAEQRTKEIGIRKVLGASVYTVWQLLSKDFVLLILISLFIATPIAYYFMHNWLQNYQYRAELSWWIFAVSGAGALLITLLTVSFQSIKAALTNPVKSLRSE